MNDTVVYNIEDDPFYTEKLRFYQGGGARSFTELPEYQEALWDKFAQVYEEETGAPLDMSLDSTDEIKEGFLNFLQRYTLLHITLETLQSENELPPSGGEFDFYLNYLNAFYGPYTTVEKTDLWNRFLRLKNFETNPADTPELREAFVKYINAMRMSELRMEAQVALSPEEAESRYILSAVMDSVGTMLKTVQGLVTTQSKLLTFYGHRREMYTKMMTRVPNLIPVDNIYTSADTTVSLPYINEQIPIGQAIQNWDLQEFTLGYNKINVKDIIEWGLSTAMLPDNLDTWIEFAGEGDPPESGQFQFKAVTDAEGVITQLKQRYTFPGHPDWIEKTIEIFDEQGNPILKPDQFGTSVPKRLPDWVEDSEDLFKEIFTELALDDDDVPPFIAYFNDPFSRTVTDENGITTTIDESRRVGLTGRYLSNNYAPNEALTDAENERIKNLTEEEFKDRATQNAVLQQYVEGIRSLRKLIADRSKQLQITLAEARQGINKITGLWTVILEMINNVTRSIFKQK